MAPGAPALEASHLRKSWPRGQRRSVTLFEDLQLAVGQKDSVAIMGASGSGKSTLLHLLAGLDRRHGGTVAWQGTPLAPLGDRALSRRRCLQVGLAMQRGALIATLSVRDNVTLAAWLAGRAVDDERALALLERLALRHLAQSRPADLSGGEAARVALARALYPQPAILLCDEPTGALDANSAALVLDLLHEAVAQGAALVTATHDPAVAERMGRVLHLRQGRLQAQASP